MAANKNTENKWMDKHKECYGYIPGVFISVKRDNKTMATIEKMGVDEVSNFTSLILT